MTETIRVVAAGDQIRRGHLPRLSHHRTRDRAGQPHHGGLRGAGDQPQRPARGVAHRERCSNGVRVYVGRKDHFLPHGRARLHDHLPHRPAARLLQGPRRALLERHRQRLGLPDRSRFRPRSSCRRACRRRITLLEAYTGPQGATGQDFTAAREPASGRAVFKTTQRLAPSEGLTIVVGWPKGYVAEPTPREQAAYFLKDNLALLGGGRRGRDRAAALLPAASGSPSGKDPEQGGHRAALHAARQPLAGGHALRGRDGLRRPGSSRPP
ncbi:MAG: hypothetical protein MZU95_04715 [Desulfomicrobium escambiense]|nr:hypothetical protein [Desulfomicrobium escambiense]